MACLFIVDDEASNARQLADVLAAELPGVHEIVCLQGLADFRRLRRRYRPNLILVELLRHQSNGFTLAAKLAAVRPAVCSSGSTPQTVIPVALLTDRDLTSDRLWASARGVNHVLSRRSGPAALARQIDQLIHSGFLPVVADEPQTPAVLSKSLMSELVTAPQTALLTCLAEDVRLLSDELPVLTTAAIARDRELHWLQNQLLYISDSDVSAAVRSLLEQCVLRAGRQQKEHSQKKSSHNKSPHNNKECGWIRAREHLLTQIGPDASEILLALCKDYCLRESPLPIDADSAESGDMLNVLAVVPDLLNRSNPSDELERLIQTESLRVLGSCMAWRDLTHLCLMLRATSAPQRWQPILQACLTGLYGWHSRQAESDAQQIIFLTLSVLNNSPVGAALAEWADECLSAEVIHKLEQSLGLMVNALDAVTPVHQRLSYLMVSVYKLRSSLELGVEPSIESTKNPRRWPLLLGCVYEIVCHGVLQPGLLTQSDLAHLSKFLQTLLCCHQQGLLPSENTLMDLAAFEVIIARRSQCGYGHDHQLLAAGLHRLPEPEGIVSNLPTDIKQSGTTLSEISHELRLLTEGAQRLGVGRVESLARLLLDCYQQLAARPELLQSQPRRLALGRAHRVLCRLLDQAAAWSPLDQSGTEFSLPAVIDNLFTQFALMTGATQAANGPRYGMDTDMLGYRDAGQAAWIQCQSLNRRLRQLLRRSEDLSAYRSLMTELLREQQAVITRYLPYQSPD